MHEDNKSCCVTIAEQDVPSKTLGDAIGDAHMNILPTKKILVCLSALAMCCIISFADQTGITVALPQIAADLSAEQTINWAGTSSLLANCVCQVLFGRFADIFGRKRVLMICLVILAIGDVACGVARTGIQFFIFRAMAGIGNGGVSSLSMVILSDIVSLKQRGKYQGILGASVGIGNSVGPFLMAAFVENYTWRAFYYLLAPLCIVASIAIYFLIDAREKELNNVLSRSEKIKKIDYFGIVAATAGLTMILVPISGGGSQYAWNSPIVISLFTIGGVCLIGFVLIEWKIPELPMIPLRIFKSPSLSLLMSSNFCFGAAYYSFTYYLPYYFQIVKGKSSLHSAVYILPLVLSQSLMSVVAGQVISWTGHYIYVIGVGYFLWCLGCGLMILWDEQVSDSINVLVLLIMGTGVGWTFQPTMVAVQAQAKKSDRAVVISTRNVVRSFGGAIGIAVGSTIISNTLLSDIISKQTENELPRAFLTYMKSHIYNRIDIANLTDEQALYVKKMYVKALRNYYYLLIPLIGLCFLSTFFLSDTGLHCIDEAPSTKAKPAVESSASSMTLHSQVKTGSRDTQDLYDAMHQKV